MLNHRDFLVDVLISVCHSKEDNYATPAEMGDGFRIGRPGSSRTILGARDVLLVTGKVDSHLTLREALMGMRKVSG